MFDSMSNKLIKVLAFHWYSFLWSNQVFFVEWKTCCSSGYGLQMFSLVCSSWSFNLTDKWWWTSQIFQVLISGKEEPEAALSPAMDAIIRIFKRVNGLPEGDGDGKTTGAAGVAFCSIRLLVASTQAISLIGKQGSLIKSIQESSGASVRVLSSGIRTSSSWHDFCLLASDLMLLHVQETSPLSLFSFAIKMLKIKTLCLYIKKCFFFFVQYLI